MKRVRAVAPKMEVAAPVAAHADNPTEIARIVIDAVKALPAPPQMPPAQPLWTKLRVKIVRDQRTGDMSELIISRAG